MPKNSQKFDVKSLKTTDIIPYARNPRKNERAITKTASSIKEFGWRQPIVVDEEMVIVAGHTRLEAAKQLKLVNVAWLLPMLASAQPPGLLDVLA